MGHPRCRVVIDVSRAHDEPREVSVVIWDLNNHAYPVSVNRVLNDTGVLHSLSLVRDMSHQIQESTGASFAHCSCPCLVQFCTTFFGSFVVKRPLASAVALRLVRQQQPQNQLPFWPQQHERSEMWPHSCQSKSWQTSRWPQGMTSQVPQASHKWHSPLPPPPTWRARPTGYVGVDGSREGNSGTGWNPSGKGYQRGGQPTMEITDRDPIPKWDFQEPGGCVRPWLRELNFLRHDTSTPLHKHGVKLYKSPLVRLVEVWQINLARSKYVLIGGLT